MLPSPSPVLSHAYLEHLDYYNTQINTGEGEMHTSVLRFLTSIIAQCLLKKKGLKPVSCVQVSNFHAYIVLD